MALCVQLAVDRGDAIEHRLRQLNRREPAIFNQLLRFVNR